MRVCRVLLATRPRASCTAVTDCRYEAPSPSPASTSTSTSIRTSTAPKNARRGVCSHKHKTQPRGARQAAPHRRDSPLSNISLRRRRAQRSSCVTSQGLEARPSAGRPGRPLPRLPRHRCRRDRQARPSDDPQSGRRLLHQTYCQKKRKKIARGRPRPVFDSCRGQNNLTEI